MNKLDQLKKEYNKLIIRNNNGEKFLESGAFLLGSEEQQKHWINGFLEITVGLSKLKYRMMKCGYIMTKEEILKGFKE